MWFIAPCKSTIWTDFIYILEAFKTPDYYPRGHFLMTLKMKVHKSCNSLTLLFSFSAKELATFVCSPLSLPSPYCARGLWRKSTDVSFFFYIKKARS